MNQRTAPHLRKPSRRAGDDTDDPRVDALAGVIVAAFFANGLPLSVAGVVMRAAASKAQARIERLIVLQALTATLTPTGLILEAVERREPGAFTRPSLSAVLAELHREGRVTRVEDRKRGTSTASWALSPEALPAVVVDGPALPGAHARAKALEVHGALRSAMKDAKPHHERTSITMTTSLRVIEVRAFNVDAAANLRGWSLHLVGGGGHIVDGEGDTALVEALAAEIAKPTPAARYTR